MRAIRVLPYAMVFGIVCAFALGGMLLEASYGIPGVSIDNRFLNNDSLLKVVGITAIIGILHAGLWLVISTVMVIRSSGTSQYSIWNLTWVLSLFAIILVIIILVIIEILLFIVVPLGRLTPP